MPSVKRLCHLAHGLLFISTLGGLCEGLNKPVRQVQALIWSKCPRVALLLLLSQTISGAGQSGWKSPGAVGLSTLSALCRNPHTYTGNLSVAISSLSEYIHLSQSIQNPSGSIHSFLMSLLAPLVPRFSHTFSQSHSYSCGIAIFCFLFSCAQTARHCGKMSRGRLVIHSFTRQIFTEQTSTMCGEHFVRNRQARHGGSQCHHTLRLVGG